MWPGLVRLSNCRCFLLGPGGQALGGESAVIGVANIARRVSRGGLVNNDALIRSLDAGLSTFSSPVASGRKSLSTVPNLVCLLREQVAPRFFA